MPRVTSKSSLARSSAIALVIALSPLATFAQSERAPAISPRVGKALNDAITALKAARCDDARRAIGELRLDRLSPYERAMTEQILFNIAYSERNDVAARQHLQNAIDSGGLNQQEAAVMQEQIKRLDAGQETTPPAASCTK
jgi:hypothetical protein